MAKVEVSLEVGGRTLTITTGEMAKQADGAAVVRYGDTVVLSAAVTAKPREGIDFFPLQVEYRERKSAAGKFPGGFYKRETRPSDDETLTSRMIDRPCRPLFPEGYNNELQVHVTVLSADETNDPDLAGLIAGSTALSLSKVPFQGPIAGVRVGLVDGTLIVNPSPEQAAESTLDLAVAGTAASIMMVECGAREVSEAQMLEALEFGHAEIKRIVAAINDVVRQAGVKKAPFTPPVHDEAMYATARKKFWDDLLKRIQTPAKHERRESLKAWKDAVVAAIGDPKLEGKAALARNAEVAHIIERLTEEGFRHLIVKGIRADGRKLDGIRPITGRVSVLPRTHGSALFTRGETQALVSTTLGSIDDEQRVEGLREEYRKKFMLHYNFPSYSVGEVKPIRGPGRREIGHGLLAERAIEAVLPAYEKFPYTIRLISDILESNGSSSMASVCGGCLALLDAGVPLQRPVAGIAMGLVLEEGEARILSDILGDEDHFGEMDFKVAGTSKGITALQMDIKNAGVSPELMAKALEQARVGRLHILEQMRQVMDGPRETMSVYAPRHLMVRIDPEKIGLLIGPGGKTIKKIQEETESEIEISDDGRCVISAKSDDGLRRAQSIVEGLTTTPEVGQVYSATVVSIKEFGAFVEFLPGAEGLIHVSELSDTYVERVDDAVKMGEKFDVKVIAIDDQGRVKLSRRALMPGGGGPREGGPGGGGPPRDRGGDRGGDRGDRGGRGGDRGGRGGGRDFRGGDRGGDRGPREGSGSGGFGQPAPAPAPTPAPSYPSAPAPTYSSAPAPAPVAPSPSMAAPGSFPDEPSLPGVPAGEPAAPRYPRRDPAPAVESAPRYPRRDPAPAPVSDPVGGIPKFGALKPIAGLRPIAAAPAGPAAPSTPVPASEGGLAAVQPGGGPGDDDQQRRRRRRGGRGRGRGRGGDRGPGGGPGPGDGPSAGPGPDSAPPAPQPPPGPNPF